MSACNAGKFLYENNNETFRKRWEDMSQFFPDDREEAGLFDPEELDEQSPLLSEDGYISYLNEFFNNKYYQSFCGRRVKASRFEVDMRDLYAEIFGYDIDGVKRTHRIGTIEDGVFGLDPGWVHLSGPNERIPVRPIADHVLEKLKRAGFVPERKSSARAGATFSIRRYDLYLVILTYNSGVGKDYLERLRASLSASGIQSEIGATSDCRLCKSKKEPDVQMLWESR